MPSKAKITEALEAVRCAQINLTNMVTMMPALGSHPLLPLVQMQVESACEALESEDRTPTPEES
jgi:hypothetical protein